MVDKATSELDATKRQTAYTTLLTEVSKQYVALGLGYGNGVAGIGPRVEQYTPRSLTGMLSELWSVRLTGTK